MSIKFVPEIAEHARKINHYLKEINGAEGKNRNTQVLLWSDGDQYSRFFMNRYFDTRQEAVVTR